MTKIKLCGLTRNCDIQWANELKPDYIGFVFYQKSKRCVSCDSAEKLCQQLDGSITPVGVFVNEKIENIKYLADNGIIRMVQLHGNEDNEYIRLLKSKVKCPLIQAFRIESEADIKKAEQSLANYIMLDSGGGTGQSFNHQLIKGVKREFFLAGGLDSKNVKKAITNYGPYAVDASSCLETDGVKDKYKMEQFVSSVRDRGDR